jgi:Flp pilus assembly protein TadG
MMQRSRRKTRGSAVIEMGLMLPWMILSFIGAFDFGAAGYALISAESAARSAANWGAASTTTANSSGFSTIACSYALDGLRFAPGVGASTTVCTGSSKVRAVTVYNPVSSSYSPIPTVKVTVSYQVSMVPFPGIIPSSIWVNRAVELPLRS